MAPSHRGGAWRCKAALWFFHVAHRLQNASESPRARCTHTTLPGGRVGLCLLLNALIQRDSAAARTLHRPRGRSACQRHADGETRCDSVFCRRGGVYARPIILLQRFSRETLRACFNSQSAVVRTAGCPCSDRPELRRLQYSKNDRQQASVSDV